MQAIQFISIDPQDFMNSIISQVKELVPQQAPSEEILTQKEAIAFLKTSRTTIIEWQKNGLIKAYYIEGSKRLYKKSELLESLKLLKSRSK